MNASECVSFESDGLRLAGALHVPDGDSPRQRRPGFLVLHGFGRLTQGEVLDRELAVAAAEERE